MMRQMNTVAAFLLVGVMTLSAVTLAPTANAATDDASGGTMVESPVEEHSGGRHKRCRGHRNETDAAKNGIGAEAAKAAALSDAGLTEDQVGTIRAKYRTKGDEEAYRVFFKYGDMVYTYKIDAESGAVLDKGTANAEDFQSKHRGRKTIDDSESGIGRSAAKETALADAGLTTEQVTRIKVRRVTENNQNVYRVSFRFDGQKYSYQINAVTGEVLSHTTEATSQSSEQ